MEKYNKFKEENLSQNQELHFKELALIEPAATALVEKLKENINKNKYDTLVSDDVGGRLVTLLLREIIRKRNPNKNIETIFLAGGATIPRKDNEKYQIFLEYLKNRTQNSKNVLIVTQYIHSGETVLQIVKALKKVGIENIDIAAITSQKKYQEYGNDIYSSYRSFRLNKYGYEVNSLLGVLEEGEIFIGQEQSSNPLIENHQKFAGVDKIERNNYQPYPTTISKKIEIEGRELSTEEIKEIFEVKDTDSRRTILKKIADPQKIAKYQEFIKRPLSEKEKKEIKENMKLARQDIKILAQRIINKVWNKD